MKLSTTRKDDIMKKLMLATAISLISVSALASSHVDRREARQEQRIQQGAQSGQLTTKEAEKLERGQQHVQNMENKAMADGRVTPKETSRLEHAQDVQSQKIYREKHDRQRDLNHDGKNDHPRNGQPGNNHPPKGNGHPPKGHGPK